MNVTLTLDDRKVGLLMRSLMDSTAMADRLALGQLELHAYYKGRAVAIRDLRREIQFQRNNQAPKPMDRLLKAARRG